MIFLVNLTASTRSLTSRGFIKNAGSARGGSNGLAERMIVGPISPNDDTGVLD